MIYELGIGIVNSFFGLALIAFWKRALKKILGASDSFQNLVEGRWITDGTTCQVWSLKEYSSYRFSNMSNIE